MKIKKYAYILQYYFEDENGNEYHFADARAMPECYNLLNNFFPYIEIIDHNAPESGDLIKVNLVAINPAPSFKQAKDAARELNNDSIKYGWLAPCYKY